jgi:hypothetical protein
MARISCNAAHLAFALALLLAARDSPALPGGLRPDTQRRAFLVIRENCLACHGSLKNSSLDLRTRDGLLKGGARGPAVVPGKPEESRLFRFISGRDKIQMPPGKKLGAAKVAILKQWIQAGAPWPAAVAVDDRPWAFQPIKRPAIPQIRNSQSAIRNPIDSFVLAKLRAKRLSLAPEADRRTLIRRLSFDLIGLPPTPAEVDAFLADRAPDAYEKLVDRLLASPRYGERWARHWLDLARYAESEGFKSDEVRPNAWRYRDYVIHSLNADMPYDRFVKEQIAGDELYPDDPDALIATGFCRHWPDESNAQNLLSRRQEILNDITETTASSILGLTVGCARCHDHKYDPITQKDYYRLQAFFAAVRPRSDLVALPPRQRAEWDAKQKAWENKTATIRTEMAAIEEPVRRRIYQDRFKRFPDDVRQAVNADPKRRTALQWVLYHKALPQLEFSDSTIVGGMKPEQKKQWTELSKSLQAFDSIKPEPLPTALGITDVGPEAPKTYRLAAGVYDKPKEEVEPGVFTILGCAVPPVPVPAANTTGRRAALADWLVSPSNPFTARVIVNRVWQYHFGRGIVGTSSDLGNAGDRPTHPELLDWLASCFAGKDEGGRRKDEGKAGAHSTFNPQPSTFNMGWSLKKLHRLIVMSATYRQACAANERAARVDPDDRFLWRFPRQRLEGEVIRDAILAVSGTLNEKRGGPSVMPDLPAGVTARGYWKATTDPTERNRRSIYVFVKRNMRFPLFEAFDMPDTHEPCARRQVTTTAPQALMLLNDESVLEAARHFAGRVIETAGSDREAQVTAAYRLAFSRVPTAEEKSLAVEFLARQTAILAGRSGNSPLLLPEPRPNDRTMGAALVDLCHALLNANEFLYTE